MKSQKATLDMENLFMNYQTNKVLILLIKSRNLNETNINLDIVVVTCPGSCLHNPVPGS